MYLGKAATSLKAYAYRRGFGVELVEIELRPGRASRTLSIEPRPLATVRLAGRVTLPEGRNSAGLTMRLWYEPGWHCEFERLADCLTAIGPPLESSSIAADGSFVFDVPDFGHDPALTRFRGKGEFSLGLVGPDGRAEFRLERDSSPLQSIPIAASYPADLRLVARAR